MKYSIIFCFLLSFVNLKLTKIPKLNFKSLLTKSSKIYSFEENEEEKDEKRCHNAGTENIDRCHNVKPSDTQNYQCCIAIYNDPNGNKTEDCELSPRPAEYIEDIINTKQFPAMAKEIVGANVYGPYKNNSFTEEELLNQQKENVEINCKDAHFKLVTGYDEYTEEDKQIWASEDYCLNYFYENFEKDSPVEYNCSNGTILQSSKDKGIQCGKLEFYIETTETHGSWSTCFLFSEEFYKKVIIPEKLKNEFEKEILQLDGVKKFSIIFSDADGKNSISFDLESSHFQIVSKFLLLLILFLF